ATGGRTYAMTLGNGVAFGPVFPGQAETAHQKDEYIAVDDLLTCTRIYAKALYELAREE
ncbi:MAG TPA: dipeptidase PepV, partial [Firmicutes bacterium]|nr:dipeptidase PepV [Bacillota bacterium]